MKNIQKIAKEIIALDINKGKYLSYVDDSTKLLNKINLESKFGGAAPKIQTLFNQLTDYISKAQYYLHQISR